MSEAGRQDTAQQNLDDDGDVVGRRCVGVGVAALCVGELATSPLTTRCQPTAS